MHPPASRYLAHTLCYMPHEWDLILLHHKIMVRNHSGMEEVHTGTSMLTAYGNACGSAMAHKVGLPVAFAVLHVLDGAVHAMGMCGPTADKAVWKGV
jgi:alpha-aminoadipic semialdehyde synthase